MRKSGVQGEDHPSPVGLVSFALAESWNAAVLLLQYDTRYRIRSRRSMRAPLHPPERGTRHRLRWLHPSTQISAPNHLELLVGVFFRFQTV